MAYNASFPRGFMLWKLISIWRKPILRTKKTSQCRIIHVINEPRSEFTAIFG
jgi:hypothetical protein